jgi:NTE family protein
MFASWEIGVWKALEPHFRPDMIVGASAGALNGWAIAGGASASELARLWLDPQTAQMMRANVLHQKARQLVEEYRPQVPFALTIVDILRFRSKVVRLPDIGWRHLAATCAMPLAFPPVRIDGRWYTDGGALGALPIYAAEEMGATRAIGLNCLNTRAFRLLRRTLRWRIPTASIEVVRIEPSLPLGSMLDTCIWSRARIERWIDLGVRDGERALAAGLLAGCCRC